MKKTLVGIFTLALAYTVNAAPAAADEPYIGEIKSFGFNFCPRGWAALNGQLLEVSSYDALFSLLGTYYGGDGRTTFGLPEMRGRAPVNTGTGPGLSVNWGIGQRGGQETVTSNIAHLPTHTHAISGGLTAKLVGDTASPDSHDPNGGYLGTFTQGEIYTDTLTQPTDMSAGAISVDESSVIVESTGGQMRMNNMAPYGVTNYCISLLGVYPSRN